MSVAPYDVRQGNFVGANVNSVTRSGTNQFTGSVYTRYRNQSYVGTEAAGQAFNPGTFKTTDTGEWVGGPIVKNKLFFFESFENQNDTRPLTTFTSNPGGAPVAGNTTRVLASDMTALSSYLKQNFNYDTGPFDNIPKLTPAKPWMIKGNYNVNNANKVTFRYNQLELEHRRQPQSGRSSLGTSPSDADDAVPDVRQLELLDAREHQVGRRRVELGVRDRSRTTSSSATPSTTRAGEQISLFPFVVIGDGAGSAYTAFGSEPFTPFNLLNYKQFQLQDSVTKVVKNHSLTFGGAFEKFHSDNSFYFGIQSAYSYNTLADFYADANGYLANPNRTVSPVDAAHLPGEVPPAAGSDDASAPAARRRVCERLRPGRVAAAVEPDRDGRPAR